MLLSQDTAALRLFDAVISSRQLPASLRDELHVWDSEVERLGTSELTPELRAKAIDLTERILAACPPDNRHRVVRASSTTSSAPPPA